MASVHSPTVFHIPYSNNGSNRGQAGDNSNEEHVLDVRERKSRSFSRISDPNWKVVSVKAIQARSAARLLTIESSRRELTRLNAQTPAVTVLHGMVTPIGGVASLGMGLAGAGEASSGHPAVAAGLLVGGGVSLAVSMGLHYWLREKVASAEQALSETRRGLTSQIEEQSKRQKFDQKCLRVDELILPYLPPDAVRDIVVNYAIEDLDKAGAE